jgi:chemotaxis protein methyltransferase CheR
MGSGLTSANRYRHVVFTTATSGRPLDLGTPLRANRGSGAVDGLAGFKGADREMDEGTFLAWLFRQAGLSLHDYRPASLMRRLPACLRVLRASTVSQARRTLHSNPHLIPIAIDALLLGVTEFFRDANVFACLEEKLRAFAAREHRDLRIWSAGCSTGAELYSVSMLLAELGLLTRCELLGTDIRSIAIELARRGVFESPAMPISRLGENSPIMSWEAQRISWRCRNLLKDVEPGPWDVILCRNLAMYLHRSAAERLWRKLSAVLRPSGLLVVGKAERPCDSAGLINVGPSIYRRVEL